MCKKFFESPKNLGNGRVQLVCQKTYEPLDLFNITLKNKNILQKMLRSKLSRNIIMGALATGTAGGAYIYWVRTKSTDESKSNTGFPFKLLPVKSKMKNSPNGCPPNCECKCVCCDPKKSKELTGKTSEVVSMKDQEQPDPKNWRSSLNLLGHQSQTKLSSVTKADIDKLAAGKADKKDEGAQNKSSLLSALIPQNDKPTGKVQSEQTTKLAVGSTQKAAPSTSGSSSWFGSLFSDDEKKVSTETKATDLVMTTTKIAQAELSKDIVDKKAAQKEDCNCDKKNGANDEKAEQDTKASSTWISNLLSVEEKPVKDIEMKKVKVITNVSKEVKPDKTQETDEKAKEKVTSNSWFSSSRSLDEKSKQKLEIKKSNVDLAKSKEEEAETSTSGLGCLFSIGDKPSGEDSIETQGSDQKKDDLEEKKINTSNPKPKSLLSSIFSVGDDTEPESSKHTGSKTTEKVEGTKIGGACAATCEKDVDTNKGVKVEDQDSNGWFGGLFSKGDDDKDDPEEENELEKNLKKESKDGKKPGEIEIKATTQKAEPKSETEVSQSGSWLGGLFSMGEKPAEDAAAQNPVTLQEAKTIETLTEDSSKIKKIEEVESSSWFSWFSGSDPKAEEREDKSTKPVSINVFPGSEENSTAKSSQPDKDSENFKWVGVIILQGDMSEESKSQPMARIIVDDKSAKTVKVE